MSELSKLCDYCKEIEDLHYLREINKYVCFDCLKKFAISHLKSRKIMQVKLPVSEDKK